MNALRYTLLVWVLCFGTGKLLAQTPPDSSLLRSSLFAPNAFSPNNDGIHDTWGIEFVGGSAFDSLRFEVKVFDRWGAIVFEANNVQQRWDASDAKLGTYYYTLAVGAQFWRGWLVLTR